MSKSKGKGRIASSGSAAFASAVRGGFGGAFSTSSTTNLSYLSEIPDFSSISDANVVVSFKNVLKKDSTTKAKALEDLLQYASEHPYEEGGGVEEAVLDAWVQLYPRTSIDNSRRVRELSHALQLDLMKSARKRMEKRLTKIIGAWLAGTFDKDRIVARAASDGLSSFLNTEEKTVQLWRRCQPQILEYATDAVKETPDTLSDERSTSKDDADAKYYRVLSGALSLVLGLLQKLDSDDVAKAQDDYDNFFSIEAVWASITAPDPHARRTVLQLILLLFEKQEGFIAAHLPRIGKHLVADGLKSSQIGSAMDFIKVLTIMTERHPGIWGEKKQPFMRLRPLLEKGSQGSPTTAAGNYWRSLDQLLAVIPQKTVTAEAAAEVIKALRSGICGREEPRANAVDAWTVYLTTIRRLADIVEGDGAQVKLFREQVYPLIDHYLHPSPDRSAWTGGTHLAVLSRAFLLVSRSPHADAASSFEAEWTKLAQHLISKMSNSLPEVSKDYQKSQSELAEEGGRWFALVEAIHQDLSKIPSSAGKGPGSSDLVDVPSVKILEAALDLLEKRNYKPFGAAAILGAAFTRTPSLIEGKGKIVAMNIFPLDDLDQASRLLASPSGSYLLTALDALGRMKTLSNQYNSAWNIAIRCLTSQSAAANISTHITQLLANTAAAHLARDCQPLQAYLQSQLLQCATGKVDSWPLFETSFTFDSLLPATSEALVGSIVAAFGKDGSSTESLAKSLQIIASKKPELLAGDEVHLDLVAKLLAAMEVADSPAKASLATLRTLVEKSPTGEGETPIVKIIQDNLDDVGLGSLEIETLVEQALSVSKQDSVESDSLLPNTNVWMDELLGVLDELDLSLSLTSNLGGAYFLAQGTRARPAQIKRDRNGYSIPIRMAIYTTRMLTSGFQLSSLPESLQVELIYLLYLVAEIGSDQVALATNNRLWSSLAQPDNLADAEDLISETRKVLNAAIGAALKTSDGEALVDAVVNIMISQCTQLAPTAVYSARALSLIFQSLIEDRGFTSKEETRIANLDIMKATPSTVMAAAAVFSGYGEMLASSKMISTLCNRLVSDVAGADSSSPKTLLVLVLLNACMSVYEVGELPVANNRLVFAVRQITGWFDEPENLSSKIATESCRALQRLLPCIKDVYGPYWEKTVEFCLSLWAKAVGDQQSTRLPYIHASLKLLSALDAIHEPNDDLDEALQSLAELRSAGMINLLGLVSDRATQPQEIVDTILCRQVEKIPLEHIKDLSNLYSLVAADSRDIQTAAYHLLSRALPAAQEQLSLDVLLDKKDAQLPGELLSLLLDAPTIDAYPDEALASFPAAIRSYLLTWHLIFAAYRTASLKVRNDYTENLKSASYVSPLLDFTFDVLGHSAARPLNLDKHGFGPESITAYDIKLADTETEERNMQWLLVNVYYLVLKYVPGLFKAWYLECRSKQTRIAVEGWTAKYFSPIIIGENLDEVAQWAAAQEAPADGDDERELLVKVSRLAREVVAGYEVDELQASIAIRVPQNYPIEGVTVVGNNRVAVNEKKWQSWLMSTQGVITFSNGSIIDGLTAFRRNVVGALKGQTECAICYSIISSDKRMPDKRCQTCKNLFHRTCLYKWFQSSNQNTCPLCRNPIDYLGADTKDKRRGGRD